MNDSDDNDTFGYVVDVACTHQSLYGINLLINYTSLHLYAILSEQLENKKVTWWQRCDSSSHIRFALTVSKSMNTASFEIRDSSPVIQSDMYLFVAVLFFIIRI